MRGMVVGEPSEEEGPPTAFGSAPSASNVASSLIGGVGATIGTTVGPEAAVVAALATPFAEAAFTATIRRAVQWGGVFGRRAAPGGDEGKLVERLEGHPQAAALLADAAFAAARTDYEVKLEAIGQAIAEGVLYEEGVKFDTEAALVRAIAALERSDVAVLAEVVRAPAGIFRADLAGAVPNLQESLDGVIGTLERMGLIAEGGGERAAPATESEIKRALESAGRARPETIRGEGLPSRFFDELAKQIAGAGEPTFYTASRMGIAVMRRYIDSAKAVGKPVLDEGALTQPFREGREEWLGPVVPNGPTWTDDRERQFGYAQGGSPHQGSRPGWLVGEGDCMECGSVMVVEANFTRAMSGQEWATIVKGARCPRGCALVGASD